MKTTLRDVENPWTLFTGCLRPSTGLDMRRSRASSYYLFVILAVIRHETTASAGWAPLLFVGAFFNNPIAIAISAGLHAYLPGRKRVLSSFWTLSQKQSLRSLTGDQVHLNAAVDEGEDDRGRASVRDRCRTRRKRIVNLTASFRMKRISAGGAPRMGPPPPLSSPK
jgi:hypothetical protein